MENAIIVLMVLGCLLAVVLCVDRAVTVWRNVTHPPNSHFAMLEADHAELKGYAHRNFHEIRSHFNNLHLANQASATQSAERLARLEASLDAVTRNLERVLQLVEKELLKRKET